MPKPYLGQQGWTNDWTSENVRVISNNFVNCL